MSTPSEPSAPGDAPPGDAAARRHWPAPGAHAEAPPPVEPAAIAQLLAWAEQSLAPRRELPVRLRRFPFTLPFLTRALLRLDALASRESRHAGLLLHAALHAVVTSNAQTLARLEALEQWRRDEEARRGAGTPSP